MGKRSGIVIFQNVRIDELPSNLADSKMLSSIPIIPDIRRMEVLPNHISQLIKEMIALTQALDSKK